tara:strand:+ start:1043 stop:1291 length:249 start_codon:yes stop_codon:yes gene_type:complete
MKIVKNTSMQGLSIPFGTPEGVKTIFLAPKQEVKVPEKWKSRVAENLLHRRMVKIKIVADAPPAPPAPRAVSAPTKRTRKSN